MSKREKQRRKSSSPENGSTEEIRSPKYLKESTMQSVWGIILFVIALFFILAAFEKGGPVGTWVYNHIKILLGFGYYLVPAVSLILSISFFTDKERAFPLSKALGSLIFVASGLGLFHLITPESGGIIGQLIANPLINLFDYTISAVSLIALFVISILIIYDAALRKDHILFWQKKELDEDGEEISDAEFIKQEREKLKNAKKGLISEDDSKGQDGTDVKDKHSVLDAIKNTFGGATNTEPKITNGGAVQTNTGTPVDNDLIQVSRRSLVLGKAFVPPPLSLLENDKGKPEVGDIKANSNIIKRTLQNFGIDVEMDEVSIGPSVTRYALKPAEGVKLSKILTLQDNLSLALAAHPIRIEAPIPGKSLVGIEIPNSVKTMVGLGTLLGQDEYQKSEKSLMVGLGKGISGKSHFGNLAKMPHLLIAGATGSGKSVTIHTIITSLLYRNSADNLRMIMIDPKRVELTLYNKIPHLLTPVITDAKKAILSLKWAAKEMDRRYNVLEKNTVRDIDSYHKNIVTPALEKQKKKDYVPDENEEVIDPMPYIVIIIDELADIMQTYPRELEAGIVRLAQMSRAVGIHLILSTQRPSVNVITGLIKANIPARIALQVASQIDSRTILDMRGAEELLGAGDMLYLSGDMSTPQRIQSAYISESEVKKVVNYLIENNDSLPSEIAISGDSVTSNGQAPDPIFSSSMGGGLGDALGGSMSGFDNGDDADDDLYEEAKQTVIEAGKASTSYIQRKLRVGYARAARLMDILEQKGVIGPADGAKPREVLVGRNGSGNSGSGSNSNSSGISTGVQDMHSSSDNRDEEEEIRG